MNEMNTKLERIKKSCHIGKIVSNILCTVAIVGCMASLIAGICVYTQREKFEPQLVTLQEEGKYETDRIRAVSIDLGDPDEWHSDIAAVQQTIDEYPYTFSLSTYCLLISLMTGISAVMIKLISKVFATIETEETPFNDKVIKKVLIVMLFTSAILLMTSGLGTGALGALITWVVYAVLDYGKTLQIQSDETL